MHSEQIGNRKQFFWQSKVHWVKQTFQWFNFSLWKIIVLTVHSVNGLAYCQEFDDIFALCCRWAEGDVTQNSIKSCMRQLRVTLNDSQFHCILSERRWFSKSYWTKWPRKLVAFFHGRTVKESNIFMYKPRSSFKTLGLIRLSRILSQKWQIPKLSCANCVTMQFTCYPAKCNNCLR